MHFFRRLVEWCCYLYVGPGQQQGEVDAVLSGQNGHGFLPVLNIHAVNLEEKRGVILDSLEGIKKVAVLFLN